jgi:hypothetical protein
MSTIVIINQLPIAIQQSLPMTIRTLKPEYELSELPPREREIIRKYLDNIRTIKYGTVYDLTPNISEFADFQTISSTKQLIVEYLKNYFYTSPGEYPFDPSFGCELKKHLQTKDTELRKTLVHSDIHNVINVVSEDLGVPITVESISIENTGDHVSSAYTATVAIKINQTDNYSISVNSTLA